MSASVLGTELPVRAGEHRVAVSAPGHSAFERVVKLAKGAHGRVTVSLEARPDGAPPDEASSGLASEPAGDADESPSGQSPTYLPGGLLLGGGAAAIGVGIVLPVVAQGKESDVDDLCGGSDRLAFPAEQRDPIRADLDDAETMRTAAFVGGGRRYLQAYHGPSRTG